MLNISSIEFRIVPSDACFLRLASRPVHFAIASRTFAVDPASATRDRQKYHKRMHIIRTISIRMLPYRLTSIASKSRARPSCVCYMAGLENFLPSKPKHAGSLVSPRWKGAAGHFSRTKFFRRGPLCRDFSRTCGSRECAKPNGYVCARPAPQPRTFRGCRRP